MSFEGTIVNGMVVFDEPPALPDGTRVVVVVKAPTDADDQDNPPPPSPTVTYAPHLAILRQSIADAQAGKPGTTLEQFAAELDQEFGQPPASEVGAMLLRHAGKAQGLP